MRFERHGTLFKRDGERGTWSETYDQPALDRARFLAFHAMDRAYWFKPWRKLPLTVDRLLEKRHRCSDDCQAEATDRDGVSRGMVCNYMPLSVRMDLVCYSLDQKNNTDVRYTRT